jgi:hypothetical protein
MPQPALDIHKYLKFALPAVSEKYPPGTGGTGARSEWPEGTLKGIETLDNFGELVTACEYNSPSGQQSHCSCNGDGAGARYG